jgi:arsenate reductase
MSKLTFYGYKKCSTCRKAEKALEKMGRDYEFIDITEAPPAQGDLRKIIKQSGAELKKFFNTSGVQYKELNMKDKIPGLSEAQVLALLSGNGRLLKRPLVTDGSRATVGFDEKIFTKTWK